MMLAAAGPSPFDLRRAESAHLGQHLFFASRGEARLQERAELLLVRLILVDVGNAQLRFPVERMRRAFKHLLLLRDGREH